MRQWISHQRRSRHYLSTPRTRFKQRDEGVCFIRRQRLLVAQRLYCTLNHCLGVQHGYLATTTEFVSDQSTPNERQASFRKNVNSCTVRKKRQQLIPNAIGDQLHSRHEHHLHLQDTNLYPAVPNLEVIIIRTAYPRELPVSFPSRSPRAHVSKASTSTLGVQSATVNQ